MTEPNPPTPAEPVAPAPAISPPATPPQAQAQPRPPQVQTQTRPPERRGGPPSPGDRGPRKDLPQRGDRPRNDGTKPVDLGRTDFNALRPSKRDLDADLERELDAALAGFDPKGTIVADEKKRSVPGAPRVREKKRGRIVAIHGKDVFIDVPGGRGQGVLPMLQFTEGKPVIGEEVEFDIDGYDGANGLLNLTMIGSVQNVTDWSSLARGMVIEAKVTGLNKNATGLQVEVNGIKGFMPVSQIDMYRVEKPEDFVNQKIKCMVIEIDPAERNLIVSRRSLLERDKQEKAEKFWATIEEGQVKVGIVRSIKAFGAFVELDGAADGLIPISEMSWSRVNDANEVVKLGQKVEVVVQRLDKETRKIGLSLKALIRSPWDDFAEATKPGAKLNGKVTRVEDFGAFVEVAPGVEGLVHVSELSMMRIRRVRDAVTEGQEITVQVISIDPAARRMALSLKSLQAEAEAEEAVKTQEEKEADIQAAEARIAARLTDPNSKLRGGIGGSRMTFEMGE